MTPSPPALDTAAARGPEDVRAMPARTIGYSIPSRSHRGVRRVGRAMVQEGSCSAGGGAVGRIRHCQFRVIRDGRFLAIGTKIPQRTSSAQDIDEACSAAVELQPKRIERPRHPPGSRSHPHTGTPPARGRRRVSRQRNCSMISFPSSRRRRRQTLNVSANCYARCFADERVGYNAAIG